MLQNLKLSLTDINVLKLVQRDWGVSRQVLAERAGMSVSTLWRRLNELEEKGAISKRVALLDPRVIGVPECIFLSVNLENHEKDTRTRFETFVARAPQILECFSITGGFDYMLIVRTKSVMDFESFLMEEILGHPSVASASSQISLRQLKYSTELPL